MEIEPQKGVEQQQVARWEWGFHRVKWGLALGTTWHWVTFYAN